MTIWFYYSARLTSAFYGGPSARGPAGRGTRHRQEWTARAERANFKITAIDPPAIPVEFPNKKRGRGDLLTPPHRRSPGPVPPKREKVPGPPFSRLERLRHHDVLLAVGGALGRRRGGVRGDGVAARHMGGAKRGPTMGGGNCDGNGLAPRPKTGMYIGRGLPAGT